MINNRRAGLSRYVCTAKMNSYMAFIFCWMKDEVKRVGAQNNNIKTVKEMQPNLVNRKFSTIV